MEACILGMGIAALCLLIFVYLVATNRIALFKSRREGGAKAEKAVLKYTYRYKTELSVEKCVSRLSQKQASRIFEYEFRKDEDSGIYTVRLEAVLRYYNPCGSCTYVLEFQENNGVTGIELRLRSGEDRLFARAFDVEMDEFMMEMLEAKNVKTLEAGAKER